MSAHQAGPPSRPCPAIGVSPPTGLLRGSSSGGREPGLSTGSLLTPELQDSGAPLGESCLCSTSFSLCFLHNLAPDVGLRARLATKTVKKYLPSRKSKGKQHLGGFFQGKKK